MAKARNLSLLSTEALLKLRDDVIAALSRRADVIKNELASLGSDYARVGRIAIYGRKSLKGRKVAPKYRDKAGNTWSGRGAQPRWMTAAIKAGAKRDDFLIEKPARKVVRPARKKARRKK
jgi:DNA-binding protein H-NS